MVAVHIPLRWKGNQQVWLQQVIENYYQRFSAKLSYV